MHRTRNHEGNSTGHSEIGGSTPDISGTVRTVPLYYSDHMRKKLNIVQTSRATIVEAPSGYGKTTAIRDYLQKSAKPGEVHWFTAVDEAPTALYRRFCREIEKIDAQVGERLRGIDFPNAFTTGEVCDAFRSVKCGQRTLLVIDDFHHMFPAMPASFLPALLGHTCDQFHIIIITQLLGQEFQTAVAGFGIPHITASDMQWDAWDIRRYFALAGVEISQDVANDIKKHTDGWLIAVHLQLHTLQETGSFSTEAVCKLMEHLIWNKMTTAQQNLFMRASPFESFTVERLCKMLSCDTLPAFAAESLSMPFIRYSAEQQTYEPHSILLNLVRMKRREKGGTFDKECLMQAGDLCRDESNLAEALVFYAQIKDYGRILSLDISQLICAEIGDRTFCDIALDIASNCPVKHRREHPLSMLRVAWAVRLLDKVSEFETLMEELDGFIPQTGALRAEWLLLSAYIYYPSLEEMLPPVKKAATLFDGARSKVILPEAPWAFYEYVQMAAFHIKAGAADQEADMLEEFLAIYTQMTGGHGSGAGSMFRAELELCRCETAKAEIQAHKTVYIAESNKQKILQISAARMLATIALLKSDTDEWHKQVASLEQAASGSHQNTWVYRSFLDVVRGAILAELRDFTRIPDWMKNTEFTSSHLPASIIRNATTVHALCLIGQNDYARLVGFGQAVHRDKYSVFSEHIHYLLMAIGYASLGDNEQAYINLETSADKALPDGIFHYLAGFSALMEGVSEDLFGTKYPELFAEFQEYKEHYLARWLTLRNTIVVDELPSGLTEREHQIAMLAADGLRNNEIAEKLFVSENTVRAHLRAVYQKLDIDRRAKLSKVLK